ncbi:hypothetical protein CEUSTIGMA_g11740.t1 [Chlamydomonas eustigma]|uniref:Clathrin light chain n=1 Tax=Chlamydomonas eustigma TaxID=1157962 RepID=A0A250XML7_9CHLO|nr:hypothetical protein CEUSTIGMA_g11740.t1 [Chlamydomonas eustigma]|eukprot:GAX84318.1 hypothetical protein CEUSTIGMA_g11740.t1 [Chlamydomonas eustigma]
MADFVDDPFGGDDQMFVNAAPPPLQGSFSAEARAVPVDLSMFENQEQVPTEDFGAVSSDVVQLSHQESQAAFIGGYIPQNDPVNVIPATPRTPATEDPRILLNRKNEELLAKKDIEEAASKKAASERGKAHITKFIDDRTKAITSRKQSNRDAETASPESGVPRGSTWERVNLLINYSQDKIHTKDLSRFKSTLQTCKDLDVAVAAI